MTQGYDFSKLTASQQDLLTFQGWHPLVHTGFSQPLPRTVKKLVERGLLVEYEVLHLGSYVKTYIVPMVTHVAWCNHCADIEKRRAEQPPPMWQCSHCFMTQRGRATKASVCIHCCMPKVAA